MKKLSFYKNAPRAKRLSLKQDAVVDDLAITTRLGVCHGDVPKMRVLVSMNEKTQVIQTHVHVESRAYLFQLEYQFRPSPFRHHRQFHHGATSTKTTLFVFFAEHGHLFYGGEFQLDHEFVVNKVFITDKGFPALDGNENSLFRFARSRAKGHVLVTSCHTSIDHFVFSAFRRQGFFL
jgi:hypothetical protein